LHTFNFDAREASERADVLKEIADDLISSGRLPDDEIIFREKRIHLIVNAYFILNHAYKKWRIDDGHFTQNEKIAALFSVAIMTFKPFRPLDPEKVTTRAQLKANEIYALELASVIINASLRPNPDVSSNSMRRIMDILSGIYSQTLEAYVQDVNYQCAKKTTEYDLDFHESDKLPVDSLITIYELLPKRR
jgi:hypothetical protein